MRQSHNSYIPLFPQKAFKQLVILLTICLIMSLFKEAHTQASITPNPVIKTINQLTTYQFTIVDTLIRTTVDSGATLDIFFDSTQFSLTAGNSFTCYNTANPSILYTCSARTSNIIRMLNPAPGVSVFGFSIDGIYNPPNTRKITFSYQFRNSATTLLSTAVSEPYGGYTPGSLQACSAVFLPNTVHQVGELTIQITVGNQINALGSIHVTFPSQWTGAANSSFPPIFSSASDQVCTTLSTGGFLSTSLTCTKFDQKILLSNWVSKTTPGGTTVSFKIGNIRAPPTSAPTYTITITTQSSDGSDIDQTICSITAVNPTSVSNLLEGQSLYELGKTSALVLSFSTPTPMISGDSFRISAEGMNSSFFTLSVSNQGFITFQSTVFIGSTSDTTEISGTIGTMSVLSQGSTLTIAEGLFLQPLISSGSRSLTFGLSRNGYDYAEQQFEVTVGASTFQSVLVSASPTTVSSSSQYTFRLGINNPLASGAEVEITLPSELWIADGSCSAIVSSTRNPTHINTLGVSCLASANQLIRVSSISNASLVSTDTLTVKVNSIQNSKTSQPTGNFIIKSFYNSLQAQPTDSSSDQSITMTPALISSATIVPSSSVVAAETIYSFTFTVRTVFLANSVLRIRLPNQLTVGSSLSASYKITEPSSSPTAEAACSVSSQSQSSNIFLLVQQLSTVDLTAGTVIEVKVSYLVNPPSMKPSTSFGLYQVDLNGYIVEQVQSGLRVTATSPNSFTDFFAGDRAIRINGENTVYTLNFKSQVDLKVNDYLELALQTTANVDSEMYLVDTSTTSCEVNYVASNLTVMNVPVTCQRQSNKLLKINLGGAITSGESYQLSVDSLKRARTKATPGYLQLTSYEYVSGSLSYQISRSRLNPQPNNQANSILSIALNILTTPSQLFTYQSFRVTVQVSNSLFNNDILVVRVPQIYYFTSSILTTTNSSDLSAISSQSLCTGTQFFCSHFGGDSHRIKVQEFTSLFSNTQTLSITLKNNLYLSPSTFNFDSYRFEASTFTQQGLSIDITTSTSDLSGASFYLTCSINLDTNHCRTCSAVSGDCLTCYQPVAYNSQTIEFDGFIYLTSDKKCVTECGVGYFVNNASGVCTTCDSPCLRCQNSATNCLSCLQSIPNNKYFSGNNSCLLNCPTGYYADSSNTCTACNSNCNSCIGNAFTCTSCTNSTFLDPTTNQCVDSLSCPDNTYPNLNDNSCEQCHFSCDGCSGSSSNCNTCANGYIADFSNSSFLNCTNSCPDGLVNDTINGLGCRCQTQCETCAGRTSSCISCDSTSSYKYLYASTCLILCPQTTYLQTVSGVQICLDCAEPNCRRCDSSTCFQCTGSYLLYEGVCVQTCPTASVLEVISGVRTCKTCEVGCINCQKGVDECSTCLSGYLKEGNTTHVYCTTVCSNGYVNFNSTVCYTSCPSGYQNVSNICQITTDGNGSGSQLSETRSIPFPFAIASAVLVGTVLLAKLVLPYILVSNLLSAVFGLLEPISWLIAVVVAIVETGGGQHWQKCSKGVYLLIVAVICNLILNVVGIVFFCKYIFKKDSKFQNMANHNQKKSCLGVCPLYTTMTLACSFSHKLLQLLFSNFLGSKHFSYKVQTVTNMEPLNYVLFVSLVPSLLAIAGSSLISYELQGYNTDSSSFIVSLDAIIITVLGIVVSIWVANRNEDDYEVEVHGGIRPQKHYQTEEIFVEANQEDLSQNINQIFLEESGLRKTNLSQDKLESKNYYYKTSRIRGRQCTEHSQNPLDKKRNVQGPLNHRKIKSIDHSDEQSSQALVFNENKHRRSLNRGPNKGTNRGTKDQFSDNWDQENNGQEESQIEVIQLQGGHKSLQLRDSFKGQTHDDFKDIPLISKVQKQSQLIQKNKKIKPQELQKMTVSQKQQLKKRVQSILEQIPTQQKDVLLVLKGQSRPEQPQKLKKHQKEVEQVCDLKNTDKFDKLSAREKVLAQKVRAAVDLLKRKQIRVEQYLLYNEIIKEEEGEYESQGSDQISEIKNSLRENSRPSHSQVAQDDQLQEVINLSPKKVILQGNQQYGNQQYDKQPAHDKQRGQKTIKKEKKHRIKNKKAGRLNDLQVNYNYQDRTREELDKEQNKQQQQFSSQNEPSLPKVSTNIVGLKKNKNLSQQYLHKKNAKHQQRSGTKDLHMINIGSSRINNRSKHKRQNQSQQDDIYHHKYLHSTQNIDPQRNSPQRERVDNQLPNFQDSQNQIQTLKSFQHPQLQFYNQISPSKFNIQNQRFDFNDQASDVPTRPIIRQEDQSRRVQKNKVCQNDGFKFYDQENFDHLAQDFDDAPIQDRINSSINRYPSTHNIDYESIVRKNLQNEKLRQLEKIYLPRMESKYDKKDKKKRNRSNSRYVNEKDNF